MTPSAALSDDELTSLLEQTSRTFALAIPLLEEPLATDVGLAYLLFRIADTLEDAPRWTRDQRLAALDSFGDWIASEGDEPLGRRWLEEIVRSPPTDDPGCLALLARADAVRSALVGRGAQIAELVALDVCRTSSRMAAFVARQSEDGGLTLDDMNDLDDYCYAVAGIVGELLTELFVVREDEDAVRRGEMESGLRAVHPLLKDLAPTFGKGLQLVNILKDAPSDALEGRVYVPPAVGRAAVFAEARAALERAARYVDLLGRAGASAGVRAFCDLPARLAVATLERLDVGAPKLTREDVFRILGEVGREARTERSSHVRELSRAR